MWALAPDVRLRAPLTALLILVGVAPVALVVAYYAVTFGLSPVGVAWTGVMVLAGQPLDALVAALALSIVLGCAVSAVIVALRAGRQRPEDAPITVRGPISYAGPGSLGGTESALRR
jgi:hypothetical protein